MLRKASIVNLETESISGCSNTTGAPSEMRLKSNVRTLYERMQAALRHGRRKQKRGLEIVRPCGKCFITINFLTNVVLQSKPFGLKKEPVLLPGISQEE
jgi:hypothetical protein